MEELVVAQNTAEGVPASKSESLRDQVFARLKASGIHLGLSLLIFSITVALLVAAWYPPPYFYTDGLWQGLRIAVLVDLVLGPLLTLAIFRRGKPGLKFDLVCIAAVQVIALFYGVYTIYTQRPYFTVFADGRFNTVRWVDIANKGRPAAELQALHVKGDERPPLIVVPPPKDAQEGLAREIGMILGTEGATKFRVKDYQLLDSAVWQRMLEDRVSAAQIKANKTLQLRLDDLAAAQKKQAAELAVFRLSGRFEDAWIVLDLASGKLVGYLN